MAAPRIAASAAPQRRSARFSTSRGAAGAKLDLRPRHRALSPAPATQSSGCCFGHVDQSAHRLRHRFGCRPVGDGVEPARRRAGSTRRRSAPGRCRRRRAPLDADPYTRAALERSGEIPLAVGEGLQFIARADDSGAALESALRLSRRPHDAARPLLDLEPHRPAGLSGRKSDRALRISIERNSARRRRRLRHRGLRASAMPAIGCRSARKDRFALALRLYDSPRQRDGRRDREIRDAAHRQGKLPVNLRRRVDRCPDGRAGRGDDRRARAYRRDPRSSRSTRRATPLRD